MQDHPFFDEPNPGHFTAFVILIAALIVFAARGLEKHYTPKPSNELTADVGPMIQGGNMFSKEMAKAFSERAMLDGELTHVSEQSDETIAVFAYQGNIFTVTFPKGTTEKRVRAYVDQVRAARPPCRPKGSVWRCLTNEVGCAEPVTVRGEPLCEVACPHITIERATCKEAPDELLI